MLSAMLPIFLLTTSVWAAAAQSQNTYCAGCDPCSAHNFAIQAFSSGQIVVSNTNTQVSGWAVRASVQHAACGCMCL